MTCDDVFDVLTRGPFPSGSADDEHVERHLVGCHECRRLATALRPAVELFQEAIDPEESYGLPGYRGRVALPGADDLLEHCQDKAGDEHSGLAGAGWRAAWIRADAAARRYGARPAPRVPYVGVRGEPPASFVRRVTRARGNLLRFAAAVLLGVAAAVGSRGLVTLQATSADVPDGPKTTSVVQTSLPADDGGKPNLRWLASLALPATCVPQLSLDAPRNTRNAAGNSLGGIQLASADAARIECCTNCHNSTRNGLLSTAGRSVVAQACTACH